MSINNLVRDNVLNLQPYLSARRLGGQGNIWLNANEYPVSPDYKFYSNNINRYPSCQPAKLINKYAAYAGVLSEQVLACRGSDEGIELLIKTFCNPGQDSVLFCPPTYGMYSVSAKTFGVKTKPIPTDQDWQLDLTEICNQLDGVKLIYICNPNNPTGNLILPKTIKSLLKIIRGRALLVIDEAYIDFCIQYSLVTWLAEHQNLVILRTLSKAFALAGLRCGFVLSNTEVIQLLLKVITPYPIPLPVTDIAEQALSVHKIKQTQAQLLEIISNRDKLAYELKKCPCIHTVYPSKSNYLLVRCNPDYRVFQILWDKGIIVRDQSMQYGLNHCIRITIGNTTECQNILSELKTLKSQDPFIKEPA